MLVFQLVISINKIIVLSKDINTLNNGTINQNNN